MNNREESYITFCKSHDGNWSARDLFNGGYQAGLASQAAELSSNPLQLPTMSQFASKADYEAAMQSQAQQESSKDVNEAIQLLSSVFDAWENGTDCYDDFDGVSGSFIGKAFNLDDEIFKRCCDLLNRVNPPRNVSQAQQTENLITRKAFICPACEGVDADSPVSSCHCMENDSNTFIEGTITYRIPPAPEGGA